MVNFLRRSTKRSFVALLLIASLISVASPIAAASGLEGKKSDSVKAADNSGSASAATRETPSPSAAGGRKTINVAYSLYGDSFAVDSPRVAPTEPAPSVPQKSGKSSSSPSSNVVSTAPMTAGEKFNYFMKRSFLSVTPYALSIFNGVVSEATDNDHGRHMTAGDFMADSMTHAARGFTFRATANFFEKFAFATVLRQDPRYHRAPGKRSMGARVIYAATRVFVTQGDRCGCNQFNFSFLGGGLAASGLAEQWVRPEDRGIDAVFRRWGSHIGVRMFTNLLSEFIGGQ
jgi:hypothetical protein